MAPRHHLPLSRRARNLVAPLVVSALAIPLLSGPPAQSAVQSASAAAAPSASQTSFGGSSATGPCAHKPRPRNTGARGDLPRKAKTVLRNGDRLRNAKVSNLVISGRNVKVRNVRVTGDVLITGTKVRLKRVTAKHIGISSAVNVVVARSSIGYGDDDGIHVTSDGDRRVRRVVLRYNLIHHPRAPQGSHYDGTQVRGVKNMVIRCSVYRAGPFQETFNAGIYLENANGGNTGVTVARNWIYGSAWSVMVGTDDARFVRNKMGGDQHWGYCYGGGDFTSRKNIKLPNRRKINLCGQG